MKLLVLSDIVSVVSSLFVLYIYYRKNIRDDFHTDPAVKPSSFMAKKNPVVIMGNGPGSEEK